jgi:hypothetical protein
MAERSADRTVAPASGLPSGAWILLGFSAASSACALLAPFVSGLRGFYSDAALETFSKLTPASILVSVVVSAVVAAVGIRRARRTHQVKLTVDLANELFGDYGFHAHALQAHRKLRRLIRDDAFPWDYEVWFQEAGNEGFPLSPEDFSAVSKVLRIYFRLRVLDERRELDRPLAIELFRQNYRWWRPFQERLRAGGSTRSGAVHGAYLEPVPFLASATERARIEPDSV